MIIEFLTWLTASAAPSARKAGLVAEVAGIAGRHRRNKTAWQQHLDKTKVFIDGKVTHADPDKPILILGAGLCLDLPLAKLNAHPSGTILMDAVIPLQTRIKCLGMKNISFQCADVTGFLSAFWNSKKGQSVTPPAEAPKFPTKFGMVISCNILSQLPLSFASSPPTDETEQRLTASIQVAHMRALNDTKCPLILISDFERIENTDKSTNMVPTVAPQLLPGDPHEQWKWHIAPKGEVQKDLDITLKVGAWFLSSC